MQSSISELDEELQDPIRWELLQIASDNAEIFSAVVKSLSDAIEKRNRAVMRMDKTGPELASLANALANSVVESIDGLADETESVVSQTFGFQTLLVITNANSLLFPHRLYCSLD